MKKLSPVKSLGDLRTRAKTDPRYLQLAISAAANLGQGPLEQVGDAVNFERAMRWLAVNANETDSESGVVAEVNFVR